MSQDWKDAFKSAISIGESYGMEMATVWHAPFRIDVSSALKPGTNEIVLKVTNAWVNRLIGDRQPDAKIKYTFSTWLAYSKDSPLQASDLIGPVEIIRESSQTTE